MTEQKWRGQTATITVSGGNLPAEPIGVIDNPEISAPEQEVQELRGAGSAERQDIMKTSVSCVGSGDIAAWDTETWDRLVDYDEAAGELDTSAEVQTFTMTFTFNANDGTTKEITLKDGYIDGSVPLGGSREEWIGFTLELQGRQLSITNTTPA